MEGRRRQMCRQGESRGRILTLAQIERNMGEERKKRKEQFIGQTQTLTLTLTLTLPRISLLGLMEGNYRRWNLCWIFENYEEVFIKYFICLNTHYKFIRR